MRCAAQIELHNLLTFVCQCLSTLFWVDTSIGVQDWRIDWDELRPPSRSVPAAQRYTVLYYMSNDEDQTLNNDTKDLSRRLKNWPGFEQWILALISCQEIQLAPPWQQWYSVPCFSSEQWSRKRTPQNRGGLMVWPSLFWSWSHVPCFSSYLILSHFPGFWHFLLSPCNLPWPLQNYSFWGQELAVGALSPSTIIFRVHQYPVRAVDVEDASKAATGSIKEATEELPPTLPRQCIATAQHRTLPSGDKPCQIATKSSLTFGQ